MKKIIYFIISLVIGCTNTGSVFVDSIKPDSTAGLASVSTFYYSKCEHSFSGEIHHWRKPREEKVHWLRSSGYKVYFSPGKYKVGFSCQHPKTAECIDDNMEISTGRWPEKTIQVKADIEYVMYCDKNGSIVFEPAG